MTAPLTSRGRVGPFDVTVTLPGRPMIVGTTVDPAAYEERLPRYPGSRMCRVFGYPGTGLPPWRARRVGNVVDDRIERVLRIAPGTIIAGTFKDWNDDASARAAVNAWIDEIPPEVDDARLAWMHEADRKGVDPTLYRRRQWLLAEWIADHPRGELVTQTPTSTYMWTLDDAAGKGRGDWSKYLAGVGITAVDVYAPSWAPTYPDPAKFVEPLRRLQDITGGDVEVPELGAARLDGDPTGERRAEWIVDVAGRLRAIGVTAVAWWDDYGTNGTDLRLAVGDEVSPEVEAWRAVIAGTA